LIFLDNPTKNAAKARVKVDNDMPVTTYNLAPDEIYPLVHNYTINNVITLNWALTRIYGWLNKAIPQPFWLRPIKIMLHSFILK
jgi:beta-galactosidase